MKKQIAVIMAAATAVTTVAPAIANAEIKNNENASITTIVDAAKKALADKYDDAKVDGINSSNGSDLRKPYLNSKYAVLVKGADSYGDGFEAIDTAEKTHEYATLDTVEILGEKGGWYAVTDSAKLETLLEKNSTEEKAKKIKVAIVDKGSKDGKATISTTNEVYNNSAALITAAEEIIKEAKENDKDTKPTFVKELKANDTVLVSDKFKVADAKMPETVNELKLTLTGGKVITLKVSSEKIDLAKAYNDKNAIIKLDDTNNTQNTLDAVDHFALVENKDGLTSVVDIPNGDTTMYSFKDVSETKIDLGNIYARETGYTEKGKDFVNGIIDAKKDPFKFNYNGVNYKIDATAGQEGDVLQKAIEAGKIDKVGDNYVLKFDVPVLDANDDGRKKTLQFSIDGKTQKDLADVLRDLKGSTKVVTGHFTKLAGDDRYQTAIEISAEQFDKGGASSVVIVGGQAQLDGLSAAPLASAKNAPLLLASPKSGLSNATLDEIGRATNNGLKNKTVYIVGGKNSVPESVEKQLADKFGAVVVRVSGEDRMATSLQVSKRLKYDKHISAESNIFFVGKDGAADAMSVSAVAAKVKTTSETVDGKEVVKVSDPREVSPIVVVGKDGINRDTRDFLEKELETKKDSTKSYVVGGVSTVGTQSYKDAAELTIVERISGEDRIETNVNLINKFYKNDKAADQMKAEGAVFASGKNAYLVDAQTAGFFAAANKAPIVLTNDTLTKDQVKLMEKGGALEGLRSNIFQVGGVVSAEAMKVVVEKLDL
ncbi:cell wall-binding repeat-containing protein [Peptostreptococcus faecalis]|uniref:cell wall-binding repeat-containing protein n=1 Tax=Peptostreptococcus faecalis TaxID=2045015 RepID=UPI000C79EC75|nr:cell wall-binding repeat-containing protein [Peptostreptococcus faecalis]